MPAPVYTADYAGTWFPESKNEKGFKATGPGTAIPKGSLVRFDDGTGFYVIAPAGAAVPGKFAVTVKAATDDQADLELVVKGPVTVVSSTVMRRNRKVIPSATVAGQVAEGDPDAAGSIGNYMGVGLSNTRDGTGAPVTVPIGTVVIMDLGFGVSS